MRSAMGRISETPNHQLLLDLKIPWGATSKDLRFMWRSTFCVCSQNYLRIISMTGSWVVDFPPSASSRRRAWQPCGLQTNDRGSDLEIIPRKRLTLQIYKKTSETQKLWPVAKNNITNIENYEYYCGPSGSKRATSRTNSTISRQKRCNHKGATFFFGYPRSWQRNASVAAAGSSSTNFSGDHTSHDSIRCKSKHSFQILSDWKHSFQSEWSD